jgi:hypothetical protein
MYIYARNRAESGYIERRGKGRRGKAAGISCKPSDELLLLETMDTLSSEDGFPFSLFPFPALRFPFCGLLFPPHVAVS